MPVGRKVHCTTDPQAPSKKTLVDRNSIGHIVLSYLGLPIRVGVYGCAYKDIDMFFFSVVYVVMSYIFQILYATPQFFIFIS